MNGTGLKELNNPSAALVAVAFLCHDYLVYLVLGDLSGLANLGAVQPKARSGYTQYGELEESQSEIDRTTSKPIWKSFEKAHLLRRFMDDPELYAFATLRAESFGV